jgi:hypothetical protein
MEHESKHWSDIPKTLDMVRYSNWISYESIVKKRKDKEYMKNQFKKYNFKKQQVKIVWRVKIWLWKRVNTLKASTNTRSKGQDEHITTTANNICVDWGEAHSGRSGGKIKVEGKVR